MSLLESRLGRTVATLGFVGILSVAGCSGEVRAVSSPGGVIRESSGLLLGRNYYSMLLREPCLFAPGQTIPVEGYLEKVDGIENTPLGVGLQRKYGDISVFVYDLRENDSRDKGVLSISLDVPLTQAAKVRTLGNMEGIPAPDGTQCVYRIGEAKVLE